MALKDEILVLLSAQPGQPHSGQQLAAALGVSRAAVWKGIEALRADGLAIEAATNRGYTLAAGDLLLAAPIMAALRGEAAGLQVECLPCTPGTNAALRERAANGAPEGLVLAANEQTAGRGRSGRAFYAPAGGLYISLLLRPKLAAPQATLITAAAAVAAAEAAEEVCAGAIQIKWVNDLQRAGRKVCGILTEAALDLESGRLDYAVLGLGFNLCTPAGGWPSELEGIAGSLLDSPTPPPGTRNALAAAFLNHFMPLYRALPQRAFLRGYRTRQSLLGQPVTVRQAGQPPKPAIALQIDEDCRLVVRWPDGRTAALNSGEVQVRPA